MFLYISTFPYRTRVGRGGAAFNINGSPSILPGGGGSGRKTQQMGIGIDLGSQSVRGYSWKNGRHTSLSSGSFGNAVGLVDHLACGRDAVKETDNRHPNLVRHLTASLDLKRPLLLEHPRCGGREFEIDELLSYMLDAQRTSISKFLNSDITKASISVPLSLSATELNRLLMCCAAAGYNNVTFTPPPIAVVAYWAYCTRIIGTESIKRDILFLDCGHRFTSTAMVKTSSGSNGELRIEVVASRGIRLGGYDLDTALSSNLSTAKGNVYDSQIISAAEKAKKELSSLKEAALQVKEYKKLITHKDLAIAGEMLHGCTKAAIRAVVSGKPTLAIIVGGGSRSTIIQSYVKETFGLSVETLDCDYATVMGTAIAATGDISVEIKGSGCPYQYWACSFDPNSLIPLFENSSVEHFDCEGFMVFQRQRASFSQEDPSHDELIECARSPTHDSRSARTKTDGTTDELGDNGEGVPQRSPNLTIPAAPRETTKELVIRRYPTDLNQQLGIRFQKSENKIYVLMIRPGTLADQQQAHNSVGWIVTCCNMQPVFDVSQILRLSGGQLETRLTLKAPEDYTYATGVQFVGCCDNVGKLVLQPSGLVIGVFPQRPPVMDERRVDETQYLIALEKDRTIQTKNLGEARNDLDEVIIRANDDFHPSVLNRFISGADDLVRLAATLLDDNQVVQKKRRKNRLIVSKMKCLGKLLLKILDFQELGKQVPLASAPQSKLDELHTEYDKSCMSLQEYNSDDADDPIEVDKPFLKSTIKTKRTGTMSRIFRTGTAAGMGRRGSRVGSASPAKKKLPGIESFGSFRFNNRRISPTHSPRHSPKMGPMASPIMKPGSPIMRPLSPPGPRQQVGKSVGRSGRRKSMISRNLNSSVIWQSEAEGSVDGEYGEFPGVTCYNSESDDDNERNELRALTSALIKPTDSSKDDIGLSPTDLSPTTVPQAIKDWADGSPTISGTRRRSSTVAARRMSLPISPPLEASGSGLGYRADRRMSSFGDNVPFFPSRRGSIPSASPPMSHSIRRLSQSGDTPVKPPLHPFPTFTSPPLVASPPSNSLNASLKMRRPSASLSTSSKSDSNSRRASDALLHGIISPIETSIQRPAVTFNPKQSIHDEFLLSDDDSPGNNNTSSSTSVMVSALKQTEGIQSAATQKSSTDAGDKNNTTVSNDSKSKTTKRSTSSAPRKSSVDQVGSTASHKSGSDAKIPQDNQPDVATTPLKSAVPSSLNNSPTSPPINKVNNSSVSNKSGSKSPRSTSSTTQPKVEGTSPRNESTKPTKFAPSHKKNSTISPRAGDSKSATKTNSPQMESATHRIPKPKDLVIDMKENTAVEPLKTESPKLAVRSSTSGTPVRSSSPRIPRVAMLGSPKVAKSETPPAAKRSSSPMIPSCATRISSPKGTMLSPSKNSNRSDSPKFTSLDVSKKPSTSTVGGKSETTKTTSLCTTIDVNNRVRMTTPKPVSVDNKNIKTLSQSTPDVSRTHSKVTPKIDSRRSVSPKKGSPSVSPGRAAVRMPSPSEQNLRIKSSSPKPAFRSDVSDTTSRRSVSPKPGSASRRSVSPLILSPKSPLRRKTDIASRTNSSSQANPISPNFNSSAPVIRSKPAVGSQPTDGKFSKSISSGLRVSTNRESEKAITSVSSTMKPSKKIPRVADLVYPGHQRSVTPQTQSPTDADIASEDFLSKSSKPRKPTNDALEAIQRAAERSAVARKAREEESKNNNMTPAQLQKQKSMQAKKRQQQSSSHSQLHAIPAYDEISVDQEDIAQGTVSSLALSEATGSYEDVHSVKNTPTNRVPTTIKEQKYSNLQRHRSSTGSSIVCSPRKSPQLMLPTGEQLGGHMAISSPLRNTLNLEGTLNVHSEGNTTEEYARPMPPRVVGFSQSTPCFDAEERLQGDRSDVVVSQPIHRRVRGADSSHSRSMTEFTGAARRSLTNPSGPKPKAERNSFTGTVRSVNKKKKPISRVRSNTMIDPPMFSSQWPPERKKSAELSPRKKASASPIRPTSR